MTEKGKMNKAVERVFKKEIEEACLALQKSKLIKFTPDPCNYVDGEKDFLYNLRCG